MRKDDFQKFMFQFTRPRGARPVYKFRRGKYRVSIHAPTRGATKLGMSGNIRPHRFNSRAHEGRDTTTNAGVRRSVVFQFTRPRGARRKIRPCRDRGRRFNSRAHEGRDARAATWARSGRRFNSRAHEGRDGDEDLVYCTRAHEGRDTSIVSV